MNKISLVVVTLISLFIVMIGLGSFFTIDQGEVGVKLRYGRITGLEQPGLNFKVPLVDSIKTISVRRETHQFDQLGAYTSDQQIAHLDVSVTIDPIAEEAGGIYSQYGSVKNMVQRILQPRVLTTVKNVFGTYTAQKVVQDRKAFELQVFQALQEMTDNEPFTLVSLQIQEVSFTPEYEKAVADKQRAEVQVLTARQNAQAEIAKAEGEKQAAILKAQGEAESRKLQGDAEAAVIESKGRAEALAIAAKGEALDKNPNLVHLISVERWSGILPTTMVPGGAVPFLDLQK